MAQRAQPRQGDGVIGLGDARIGAVGGIEEHDEVVRADRDEIGFGQHAVEFPQQRRHFDHGADLEFRRRRLARADQPVELELDHSLGLDELPGLGDHGDEDLHRPAIGGRQQRPDLRAQQARPVEREAQRAEAHRRVLLGRRAQIRDHLVAADIEQAEDDRLALAQPDRLAIEDDLLADLGQMARDHELQFGAEQPDALGAGVVQHRQIGDQPRIVQERDGDAILGDRRLVLEFEIVRTPFGADPDLVDVVLLEVGGGPQEHSAGRAIDDDVVAVLADRDDIFGLPHRHQPERARNDRHMRGGAALFEDDGAEPRAVVFEQFGRSHVARHQNGVLWQFARRAGRTVAGQHPQQAVGQIVEIVQPVADIGIGRAQHAGARVVLHPLDGGFGSETVGDRLVQPVDPAAIVGEHPVGFEDVAVLAARLHVAVAQHVVDREPHGGQRVLEMLDLEIGVFGDEIGDDDARVVQHHLAQRNAFGEAGAVEGAWTAQVDVLAGLDQRVELGRRDHFGEDGRRGQHRLDFVFAVDARVAVLDDEDAQRLAGAQDRHAEEGVERVFAGFRAIGKGRMRRCLFEIEGFRLRGDEADEALAQPQGGHVHGFGLQALAGEQFELAVVAQHIEGADVRPHVFGNEIDDLVEAILRSQRLRHGFAQLPQQHARTADPCRHTLFAAPHRLL